MSLRRIVSVVTLVIGISSLVGCSAANEPSAPSAPKVTLSGNIPRSGISTKTFGSVDVNSGGAHVSARKLHRRGEAGGSVDVAVDGNGHFELDVARGSRYVVTVDDADGHSALVTFGNGESALDVSADGESAKVSVGDLEITGGTAKSDVIIGGSFGLAATRAEIDEVFEAANGAILEARAAFEEAMKAADEALKEAELATQEALRAAEEAQEAQKASGQ
jgi:hypothetical protein